MDFVTGGSAGVLSKTTTAPIERVKILMQSSSKHSSISTCFRSIASEQGISSFWRGNGSTVIRQFPQQAMNLSLKDLLKVSMPQYKA